MQFNFQKLNFRENWQKKGTSEKFWTQFDTLYYKEVSKFVIPAFRYKLLAPKITKCGDLLY